MVLIKSTRPPYAENEDNVFLFAALTLRYQPDPKRSLQIFVFPEVLPKVLHEAMEPPSMIQLLVFLILV